MKNTARSSIITQNPPIKNFELPRLSATLIARKILADIMKFRRVPESGKSCLDIDCQKCSPIYLPRIIAAIKANKPVRFVLPAFPGKSPNPEKVLGPLPDQAERLSLAFLGNLCQRIKTYYSPGIKIILCSDGRVFSDVVGMRETNVTAYQHGLERLINEMSLRDISTFNLDHFYQALNFSEMRGKLMERYGNSLDFLKKKIQSGAHSVVNADDQEANRMYRGITRFLFEDSIYAGQTKSRTAIQKESRLKAYEVIRRSNAWSELIAEYFPDAVRLSIHPQSCGAAKLGIRLIGNESWMTPWHGVALETKDGYVLLRRSKAEALGAKLIYSLDGHPSHYQLLTASRRVHEL
ncbi:pyoverdine biosynthesis protein PvcA [Legionella birminghamensis]|uniref:Pyoverdine biosynthesis protein PvcA n=1 Tax=Legionella birminghamensis TaxID=28083 RepID=A0A378IE32_9GAMM|nr:isocyanide synthase family protein [Legionella birminghamensis]KTC75362.1 pyoverdine biosynthesis protein PvcA [Legionella birminghamensis]STX33130.1 pyoverdine biosynthesis protein PvcA [Legionella birminghamensis]